MMVGNRAKKYSVYGHGAKNDVPNKIGKMKVLKTNLRFMRFVELTKEFDEMDYYLSNNEDFENLISNKAFGEVFIDWRKESELLLKDYNEGRLVNLKDNGLEPVDSMLTLLEPFLKDHDKTKYSIIGDKYLNK